MQASFNAVQTLGAELFRSSYPILSWFLWSSRSDGQHQPLFSSTFLLFAQNTYRNRGRHMQTIWKRIEDWLNIHAPELTSLLQAGASEEDIQHTETLLNVTFPEDI